MQLYADTITKAIVIRYMTSYLQLYPSLSLAVFNQRCKRVQARLRRVTVNLKQRHLWHWGLGQGHRNFSVLGLSIRHHNRSTEQRADSATENAVGPLRPLPLGGCRRTCGGGSVPEISVEV
jgi:hypothetical protein